MITPIQAVTSERASERASPAADRARGAWPGAILLLAWLLFGAALLVGYAPGGPYDAAVPFLLAVAPLAVAGFWTWRAARGDASPTGPRRLASMIMAVSAALVTASLSWTLASGAAGILPPAGWSGPVAHRLLPGQGEAWAYLVALGLSVGATAPPRWMAAILAVALVSAGAVGGGLGLLGNSAALGPGLAAPAAGCGDEIAIVGGGVRSAGWGDLDGQPLGSVQLEYRAAVEATVRYATRWGSGRARLGGVGPAQANPFDVASLGAAERSGADDLGVELVSGVAAHHCQVVVDGRTAVQMFPVLRWLSGSDWATTDAGAGLELWRGLLDYWVVQLPTSAPWPTTKLVLATVSVDGQPPDWPFPGIHATLRAISAFGDV